MRKLGIILLGILLGIGGWYVAWHSMMASQVAQVETAIKHRHDRIKTVNTTATFKADAVRASGFPFAFHVRVERPTLSQVWAGETYVVSLSQVDLVRAGSEYRLLLTRQCDALYAKDGAAPERFTVRLNKAPKVFLRGQTFDEFAVQWPGKLILNAELNGKERQIGFNLFPSQTLQYQAIPDDIARPAQIFVGMLREALVL